jgi:chitin synthase
MQSASAVVSTTSLLAQLNSSFSNGQPHQLESSTSLVVNTWASGNTVDEELARKAWEHARRRAEDGCVVLASLHHSTPSLVESFAAALPLSIPNSFFTALNALRPFLHCVTPYNPSTPCYSALSTVFTLSLEGEIQGASLSLSTAGIDTQKALVDVPAEHGYRAFDVFYYLLTSATGKEREFLGLKSPNQYALLRKTETYASPSYLPTADDAANAEDWRESLKAIGIKGADFRNLLCVLASVLRLGDAVGFLVDQEELEATCEEVGNLLEMEPEVLLRKCVTEEREVLIGAIYEALVDWVIVKANEAIRTEMRTGQTIGSSSSDAGMATPPSSQEDAVSASITVVDVPSAAVGKALSLKTVFDDTTGINSEMKEDGVQFAPAGSSVIREMNDAVSQNEADLDIPGGPLAREREVQLDRRQTALEKVGEEADGDSFMRRILYPVSGDGINLGRTGRFHLRTLLESSRVWFHLCLHPSDDSPATFSPQGAQPWSAGSVSTQIRAWRLPEWANHRNKQLDFTADFDIEEFVDRYSRLGCQGGREGVEAWIMERGWSNGEIVIGHERIWLRESAWWEAESMLDMKPLEDVSPGQMLGGMVGAGGMESNYGIQTPGSGMENPFFSQQYETNESRENVARGSHLAPSQFGAKSLAPTAAPTHRSASGGDYGLGRRGDNKWANVTYEGEVDPELADGKEIIVQKTTFGRRVWVAAAWLATWWIPSFLLNHIGRMKRPDVRLAWREKVLLMILIFLLNGTVVFYIVEFGNLLCPNWNKVWNVKEVSYHQGENDYWVAFRGGVYDLTHFWRLQHSDTDIQTTSANMLPLAGTDMTPYIVPPLWFACPGLVESKQLQLQSNSTLLYPQAEHISGAALQPDPNTKLHRNDWYTTIFQPKMKGYYKGALVTKQSEIQKTGQNSQHMWVIINKSVYDLTDYFHTLKVEDNYPLYTFLGDPAAQLIQNNPGLDITQDWETTLNYTYRTTVLNCMNNMFYIGDVDFRDTPRCQVNNYILLGFTIILCVVIATKFLAALQLGSKRRPAQQDKFVICQVPAYTEGEDSLRKGLDSLTALAYDNKRKLICVICDGMIVGGGNDRPTPKIVLDILGVDPKTDPPALPFKSVGDGSAQLNYGKVYSGLYEYEGNVVPYLVVVKVGKESEQTKSKPGNRGKRDSQILLMSFLNRVHHRAPMNPLELEMFHQINNIIGVDPELYEYLFMVDADTKVKEDSLNRLVASCANDAKIAGICGETSLENEERSWWTMIQVYEYYISHHLAKAFESLFGSVTCLPGW